jgi:ElaB protein
MENRMANQFEPQQTTLDDDLKMLSETLEEVLKSSGDKADEKYIEIKQRAEQALSDVQSRLSSSAESYCAKARNVAQHADTYVRDNPWHGVGVGATVGLILGLLLRR